MFCTIRRLIRSFHYLLSSSVLDQPNDLDLGVHFRWLGSTGYGLATVGQLHLMDELNSSNPWFLDQLPTRGLSTNGFFDGARVLDRILKGPASLNGDFEFWAETDPEFDQSEC